MRDLRHNTAVDVTIGRARDATTGAPYTGALAAGDVALSKNDGAFAAKNEATAPSHKAAGNFKCKLDVTDTSVLGIMVAAIDHSGVYSWNETFNVISQAEYDRKYGVDPIILRGGTAQAGAASSITLDASASAVDSFYVGQQVIIAGGTGAGQSRMIISYVGSTKVAAVAQAWATNPDNTSVFRILAVPGVETIKQAMIIREATATAGAATTITLDAGASAMDDFYNDQVIVIVAGLGVGQARLVEDYVGATKVATVAAWKTNPDNTSVFKVLSTRIVAAMGVTAAAIADAVCDEITAGHTTPGSLGAQTRDIWSRFANTMRKTVATGALHMFEEDGTTPLYDLERFGNSGSAEVGLDRT